ncbi:ABC transporter ATP-binding protein [Fusibacter paucivorans]|uniref:ABC transporter ATP-binding protein n=1 Tax=Fusibacter paucivorans TaxID=76009 RepID=A0ABS5PP98_9FIRM|nr:ABC transporter ATP-binding protein [Fusibacter paucivorans]
MIRIENLSFAYKRAGKSHQVFEHLDIAFKPGINVILGPNGAGKSTLLKAIFGILDYKGNVFLQETPLATMALEEKISQIAYLPQMDIEQSSLTVLEMVLLGRLPELQRKVRSEDIAYAMKSMAQLNISELASRPFTALSGGQKKLVFIAQTLVRDSDIVLLDEPINALDLKRQLELCQLLRSKVQEKPITMIIVLHDINLAVRFADHLVVLRENGTLYAVGSPKEVMTERMIEDVYGVIARVSCDEDGVPVVSPLSSFAQ